MRTIFNYLVVLFIVLCAFMACKKMDSKYKQFIVPGGKIYVGKATSPIAYDGQNRVKIFWLRGDPNAIKARIYWNNYADSVEINIPTTGDTISYIIDNLAEKYYSFIIKTYDTKGHASVPVELFGAAYGSKYSDHLINRYYDFNNPGGYTNSSLTSIRLNFKPPSDTINVATEINYTDEAGTAKKAWLSPDSLSITLNSYKTGSAILYKSSYIPSRRAIDTFLVASYDTLPPVAVRIDKSLFKEVNLPNDANTTAYGCSLSWIWDGQPGGYPNIYHTDIIPGLMPHTFTFDMGKVYNNLSQFEEIGRQDCACSNPVQFEIWGIADLTNASTTLPATDLGWKAESIAKGWVLLGTLIRTDDGIKPFNLSLVPNPKSVRYIRIRVLRSQNDGPGSHMSEVTLFYNP